MLLALRCYGRQMARLWRFTVPAMLLPALGNTCIYYVAPLIVAQLVGRFAGTSSRGSVPSSEADHRAWSTSGLQPRV